MAPMILRADAVTVRYGARTALDRVDLALQPGEVLAVVGPNGAGKSTLLAVLGGERRCDEGRVELAGRALERWPLTELARVRAVVPQTPSLSFPFTVLEVVALGRLPHAATRRDDEAIAREMLRRVGLQGLEQRLYTTLSGGERQRVHFARALAQLAAGPGVAPGAARWLLLDEPTASLDLAHVRGVARLVRELAADGVGVLVVLHDLNLAARMADRIALLAGGRVLATGAPDEVLTPALVEAAWGVAVALVPHPDGGHVVIVRDA